jgi:hypothetical protein
MAKRPPFRFQENFQVCIGARNTALSGLAKKGKPATSSTSRPDPCTELAGHMRPQGTEARLIAVAVDLHG